MTSFEEYVRARGDALLRFGYLLCGDAHQAEDFVQEALVRCHRRWGRIREDPHVYVRRAVLRQYLSWRRRAASGEIPTDLIEGEQAPNQHATSEDDDVIRGMLDRLPRRQRAVLVLRYYEDLPDGEIATLLGCSPATVRVHVHRGLARLRQQLEPADAGLSLARKGNR